MKNIIDKTCLQGLFTFFSYLFILCLTFAAPVMNQTGLTCILTSHFLHILGRRDANSRSVQVRGIKTAESYFNFKECLKWNNSCIWMLL